MAGWLRPKKNNFNSIITFRTAFSKPKSQKPSTSASAVAQNDQYANDSTGALAAALLCAAAAAAPPHLQSPQKSVLQKDHAAASSAGESFARASSLSATACTDSTEPLATRPPPVGRTAPPLPSMASAWQGGMHRLCRLASARVLPRHALDVTVARVQDGRG